MKQKLLKLSAFAFVLFAFSEIHPVYAQQNENEANENKKEKRGPDAILEHYSALYGEEFMSSTRHLRIQQEMTAFPSENKTAAGKLQGINSWEHIGGYGVPVSNSIFYTGRITDLEMRDNNTDHLRVLSASGGLWEYQNNGGTLTAVSLSSNLSSEMGGAFLTDPNDENTIFLGTGEGGVHGGTGFYKTTDRGATWNSIPTTPSISSFFELIYDPINPLIMHAATSQGYFRSDDGGNTWTLKMGGAECTDVVVDWQNNQNVYITRWGPGVFKSTDGGNTFTQLTSGGIPISNVGRSVMAMSKQNPNTIFFCLTANSTNNTTGIYKTTDGGATFVQCPMNGSGGPITDFHNGQGWYNNIIALSPVNDSIVLCGGVSVLRSYNGYDFYEIDAKHADQHAMAFSPNGADMFAGNDGGIFYSNNGGINFNSSLNSKYNITPVGQFYHFSVGKSNAKVVGGTLQDNGYQYKSSNSNYQWASDGGGDGSGVQVDPNDELIIMHGNGIFGGNLKSRRFVTTNGGGSYSDVNVGISACNDWFPEIRTDGATGVYYTNCGSWMYESYDLGITWNVMNPSAFSASILDFTVSADISGVPNLYVTFGQHKIMTYDRINQTWSDRISNIPTGVGIRKVAVDIVDPDIAYAVASGTGSGTVAKKVWKTTDRGQTWTNISGNLPNISCTDLIANPFNSSFLYLASEKGCWKSIDGGTTWNRWNNGMPESCEVTELDYADSTSLNGKFYIMCSTYGRGIWMRDVSGDDPTGFDETAANNLMQLFQNSDNPGDGNTTIGFNLKTNADVTLSIYNLIGAKVKTLINQKMQSGSHSIVVNRSELPAGVYTYTLQSGKYSVSRKMVVVKN